MCVFYLYTQVPDLYDCVKFDAIHNSRIKLVRFNHFEYKIHHIEYKIHHFEYKIHHFEYKIHHFECNTLALCFSLLCAPRLCCSAEHTGIVLQ